MINGIFSDELSRDYETFLELMGALGPARVELRNMRTGRVPALADEELREVLARCDTAEFPVTSLSPGICKSTYEVEAADQSSLVARSIEFARLVGAAKITIFAFRRPPDVPRGTEIPRAAHTLLVRSAEAILNAGLKVSIENWQSSYVATASEFAALLDRCAGLPIGLDWDPCNARAAGAHDLADEFERFSGHMTSVQVKDATLTRGKPVHTQVGKGDVGWPSIVNAMVARGWAGDVTLESHAETKVRAVSADWAAFNELLGATAKSSKTAMGGQVGTPHYGAVRQ